ncbi:MAG TPA: DUF4105 domain-containing protein [Gemmatimonadales bacterium]
MRLLISLLVALLLSPAASRVAHAQGDSLAVAGDDSSELQVFLLTMGPGEAIWEKFGHNALWIRDPRTGTDVAYNWGVFDFAASDFLPRFLRGDMLYWMEAYPAGPMVEHYVASNRSVWVQELDLTPAQERELLDFVRWNAREENRFYRYDYFLDNCSTRVRDALDGVLGGAIRATTDTVATGTSYRWHTRRLSQEQLPLYVGMDLVLGQPGDAPISAWEESFLPMRLREHLRMVRVRGPDGAERPLVRAERQLFQATRDAEPAAPRDLRIPFLLLGVAVGVAVAGLAAASARRAGAGAGFVVTGIVWSIVAGLAGTIMVLTWTSTSHVFMYRNENLLQLSPLSLALVPLLPALRRGGRRAMLAARVAVLVAGVALLGFALQALPGLDQVNGEIIALVLPIHLGIAWGSWRLARARARA